MGPRGPAFLRLGLLLAGQVGLLWLLVAEGLALAGSPPLGFGFHAGPLWRVLAAQAGASLAVAWWLGAGAGAASLTILSAATAWVALPSQNAAVVAVILGAAWVLGLLGCAAAARA